MNEIDPWVTFCISTFKRPTFLQQQLAALVKQSHPYFEIVVSDNDPDGTARTVVNSFKDNRIRYFQNAENVGMIRSFNKSIDRAETEFIIMVTDDDPVEQNFLEEAWKWIRDYPGYSLYGGFGRVNKPEGSIEVINKNDFIQEILDPDKTDALLWSSCILRKSDVLKIGKIPDYGSPHLADHSLLVMTGSIGGGVVVNRMYSHVTFHDTNFSKFNFNYYTKGCEGFYVTLDNFASKFPGKLEINSVVTKHLGKWFISNIFNLKKYYSTRKNRKMMIELERCGREILNYPFMKKFSVKYRVKKIVLSIKLKLGLLKAI